MKDFRCGPGCKISAWADGGPRWKSSQGGSRGRLGKAYGESIVVGLTGDVICRGNHWFVDAVRTGCGVIFRHCPVCLTVARGHLSVIMATERKTVPARNDVRFRMQFWLNDGRSIMLPAFLVALGIVASDHGGRSR